MTWSQPEYEAVARWLGTRTGLHFPPQRQNGAEAGIRRAMTRAGVDDPGEYRRLLEADGSALDDLVGELTIGETYFFREPAHFDFLRREVLPAARRAGRPVRAWSAGCASGEEAYSLAILFAEEGLGERAHILATDLSRPALARAHRAVYRAWSLRGDGAARALPYLHRHGDHYTLDEAVRRRVTLAYLNLALDVYPSFATSTWGMDIILCRNVLLYFNPDTVRAVARRLLASLAPGGWLLTASSDPPLGEDAVCAPVLTEAGVFYRRRETPPAGQAELPIQDERRGLSPPCRPPGQARPLADSALDKPAAPPPSDRDLLEEARDALSRGDYARAAELTGDRAAEAAGVLHVRALANLDSARAERACAAALAHHPLSQELAYLYAVLLVDLGRDEEAARAARRVLYLDRSLASAHFTLGSILWRCNDLDGARRAYRNAHRLCAARPAEEVVPLSDGEPAGRLAAAAAAQLAVLDAAREARA